MRGLPSTARMLLLASSFAWGTQVSTQQLLISRGLTRREADSVNARHRRRNKAQLAVAELDAVLDSLDALELQPEQAAHLLRSTPIATLQELLAVTSGAAAAGGSSAGAAWCSYKKQLCDCGATHRSDAAAAAATERPPPRLVAVDCEFSPLRVAAVDEAGCVLYDALVLPPVEAAGTPSKSKGMLRCDIAATPPTAQAEVRASILALLTAGDGCLWLAHTPQHDLSAPRCAKHGWYMAGTSRAYLPLGRGWPRLAGAGGRPELWAAVPLPGALGLSDPNPNPNPNPNPKP